MQTVQGGSLRFPRLSHAKKDKQRGRMLITTPAVVISLVWSTQSASASSAPRGLMVPCPLLL